MLFKTWLSFWGFLLLAGASVTRLSGQSLELARENSTAYVVVEPAQPTAVDALALRTLTNALHCVTGAAFPVVSPDALIAGASAIFVGTSAPALARLGGPDPLEGLAAEEHVARSLGRDVFLYGQGARGNLYAVMEFLEGSLEWRRFSVFAHPTFSLKPTLRLEPFLRRKSFSFAVRNTTPYFDLYYYYLRGVNEAHQWTRWNPRWESYREQGFAPVMEGFGTGGAHTLEQFLPPTPDRHRWPRYEWIEKNDYFATHPEFFGMTEGGQRHAEQLCLSNREARNELTKNILGQIQREDGKTTVISVGPNDSGGTLCHCPACKALDERYACPSGAYFDYLIEIADVLREQYPGLLVRGMAYRQEQTQQPPTLPEGMRLPPNLVIMFAPVNDAYLGDWTQPDPKLQETYRHLQGWSRIAARLWGWIYPNPYGTGEIMPLGNVQRLVTQMRLYHQAGARGLNFEHAAGVVEGGNFTELLTYLFLKLSQDIDSDVETLIREFTDAQYGPAGALVRAYLDELEQGRLAIEVMPRGVSSYSSRTYDPENWPYLTPGNLRRWQGYFDTMETQCAEDPTALANVQRLRRNLDFATLFKWLDLAREDPEYFSDPTVPSARIRAVNAAKRPDLPHAPRPQGGRSIEIFEAVIRGGGEKPLPPEFDGIDRARIRTFLPSMSANDKYNQGSFADPEAAFGYAPSVHRPNLPFTCGFYQTDTKAHGAKLSISRDEITPGVFRVYRLGEIHVTPRCSIWFASWGTGLRLGGTDGHALWEPGDPNLWDAYVSLKFEGPRYGGEPVEGLRSGEVDRVLVDRVILVKNADER